MLCGHVLFLTLNSPVEIEADNGFCVSRDRNCVLSKGRLMAFSVLDKSACASQYIPRQNLINFCRGGDSKEHGLVCVKLASCRLKRAM